MRFPNALVMLPGVSLVWQSPLTPVLISNPSTVIPERRRAAVAAALANLEVGYVEDPLTDIVEWTVVALAEFDRLTELATR